MPLQSTLRSALRHPMIMALVSFLLCLNIKEHFPFSHFPMYSLQKDETDYYYLKRTDSSLLPTVRTTGLTSTKIKKMMGHEMADIAKREKADRGQLPLTARQEAAREVMRQIRKNGIFDPAASPRQTMKEPVTLVWVKLRYVDGTVKKTITNLITE